MTDVFTYAQVADPQAELLDRIRQGIGAAGSRFGARHPVRVGWDPVDTGLWDEQVAPANQDVLVGSFGWADERVVQAVLKRSAAAFRDWRRTPLEHRLSILRRAADQIDSRRFELTGLLVREVGKPPLEALAEVDEAPVLMSIYCDRMEAADGFREVLVADGRERGESVLQPYGPWVVASPFNFPLALAVGPTAAALVTGQPVVLKPSPHGQLSAQLLGEILHDAGVPLDVFSVLPGSGDVGAMLVQSPLTRGVTFTGSHRVGREILRALAGSSTPVVCEMGGKNPAYVADSADIEEAAEGVMRASFGFSGQKCSSCSRVFVHQGVYGEFLDCLISKADNCKVGDPAVADVFTGPVINPAAVERYESTLRSIEGTGGRILAGGEVFADKTRRRGLFVAPTVVEQAAEHTVWRDELFVPIVAVAPVETLQEAIDRANATEYGLTAGIYSTDPDEVQTYFDEVEASVVYANRRSGATTGAWPGRQPISGWKASGNTGKGTGGAYYLQQYMREQSRNTVVRDVD
jgi:1-pyrroline-5-carboxylate dehydrogenase